MKYFACLYFLLLLPAVLATHGCATKSLKTENTQAVKPNTIIIRANAQIGSNAEQGESVEKNFAQIIVSPEGIILNGVKLKGIEALKQKLKKSAQPVITISSHRCTDTKLASAIMALAQEHTNTPIPFGSFGAFTDSVCP